METFPKKPSFPAAPGVASLPGTSGDQAAMYEAATNKPIHAGGGTLGQPLADTQKALVAGDAARFQDSNLSVSGRILFSAATEEVVQQWITDCHQSLPAADSVHWTTHLRAEISRLLEKLRG